MSRTLHIVSFDYPYPPDYGGIIDVYYKIQSLRHAGINIILHYFADKAQNYNALNALCEKVFYYPKTSIVNTGIFSDVPLRMFLRSDNAILNNLGQDNYPILFEGLHTSYIAKSLDLQHRKKYLRCHNAEAEYAQNMALIEENYFKRKTFEVEAKRTAKYEKDLHHFNGLFVLKSSDEDYFKRANKNVQILPIFHQDTGIEEPDGFGNYILFHGNLSVNENIQTALWIANQIAPQFYDFNFIIAGKNPDRKLLTSLSESNVDCVPNPNQAQMDDLIRNAQIVLLRTAISSGIKLKLIDSLAKGRHIIADDNTVENSGLENLVHRANSNAEVIKHIRRLMHVKVQPEMIHARITTFQSQLNNNKNAEKLIKEIFD